MLYCYVIFLCHIVVILLCHIVVILLCHIVVILQCHIAMSYCYVILLCHIAMSYCCFILLCHNTVPSNVPAFCSTAGCPKTRLTQQTTMPCCGPGPGPCPTFPRSQATSATRASADWRWTSKLGSGRWRKKLEVGSF